jgi:hypothetical protein
VESHQRTGMWFVPNAPGNGMFRTGFPDGACRFPDAAQRLPRGERCLVFAFSMPVYWY